MSSDIQQHVAVMQACGFQTVEDAIELLGLKQTETGLCKWLAERWSQFRNEEVQLEAPLFDLSRVDLLTGQVAYEADWAAKWKEAVGQSLYYAAITRRRPGILLLIENRNKDLNHMYRCQTVCLMHDIELLFYFVADNQLIHNAKASSSK